MMPPRELEPREGASAGDVPERTDGPPLRLLRGEAVRPAPDFRQRVIAALKLDPATSDDQLLRAIEREPPPQNREAEEAVVGSLMHAGLGGRAALQKVRELLRDERGDDRPDYFHFDAARVIYQAILTLASQDKAFDIISVAEQLRATETMGYLRSQGEEAFLATLTEQIATVENVTHHARIVRDKALLRRLIVATSTLRDRAHAPGEDAAKLTERLHQESVELARLVAPPAVALFDEKAFIADAQAALSRPIPKKLPFGLRALDEALGGGFPAGGVVALVAPPKHMKTALLIELMIRWARAGERVVFISGENTAQELCARLSAHEQFGTTYKFHSTIKHEQAPHQVEENRKPIDWMGGKLRIVSLPDEEVREPPGPGWVEVLQDCEKQKPPPLVVIDYVEEFADRLPRQNGETDQQINKRVMRMLKTYACRRQARVLAVCSVGRSSYSGDESVFGRSDAAPEEFRAVAKHSGYIEFAAAAQLALQFADGSGETTDESGRPCRAMKLHLAFVREGAGPTTVRIRAWGGYCRFEEDASEEAEVVDTSPELPGVPGMVLRELAKPEHEQGATARVISRLVGRRQELVTTECKTMAELGQLVELRRGRSTLYRHPRFGPAPRQVVLSLVPEAPPEAEPEDPGPGAHE